MNLTFSIDETGKLKSRRLDEDDVLAIGKTIISNAVEIQRATPKAWWDDKVAPLLKNVERVTLESQRRHQARLGQPAEIDPVEIPEDLLGWASKETLLSNGKVNNLVDDVVGDVDSISASFAKGDEGDPLAVAGRLIQGTLFSKGKAFLKKSSLRQWGEVYVRFHKPTPELEAALATLNLVEKAQRAVKLNTWHGRLMGITDPEAEIARLLEQPDEDPAPEAPQPETNPHSSLRPLVVEFEGLMVDALNMAGVIWKGDGPEAVRNRLRLVGGYLEALRVASRARSRAIAQSKKNNDPQGGGSLPDSG